MERKLGISLLGVLLVVFAVLTHYGLHTASAAPLQQTISHVLVTNVSDQAFTVSWVTDTATDGQVDWGTVTPPVTPAVDPVASTTTHYVTISGLSQNTTYYFQVTSGSTTDDNGGAFYSVTTGPTLGGNPGTKFLFGQLLQDDGTSPAPFGIVYFRLVDNDSSDSPGNSAWGSARADINGDWFFSLTRLRTEALTAYFIFTDGSDQYQYVGQGGVYGLVGEVGDERIELLPASYPFNFDIILDADPTAIRLASLSSTSGDSGVNLGLTVAAVITVLLLLVGVVRYGISAAGQKSKA